MKGAVLSARKLVPRKARNPYDHPHIPLKTLFFIQLPATSAERITLEARFAVRALLVNADKSTDAPSTLCLDRVFDPAARKPRQSFKVTVGANRTSEAARGCCFRAPLILTHLV
jgi:hypothetical protein